MQRVIAYIDGFNLYFGLRAAGFRRFYWLDICELVRLRLKPGQQLEGVKYFTARIRGPKATDLQAGAPDALRREQKRRRQSTYLEALATLPGLAIFEGHYLEKPVRCFQCGWTWEKPEEKGTDVSIATEMLVDASDDKLDLAILVSADSDLAAPVMAVNQHFGKPVVIAFPPERNSAKLKRLAKGHFKISRSTLAAAQLPDPVVKPGGTELHRPGNWR